MVTRVFKCNKCGYKFAIKQSIKQEPVEGYCPECSSKLHQEYGTEIDWYMFTTPGRGAISNRFATKGNGSKRPWNVIHRKKKE